MSKRLLELIRNRDLDAFETRCLELLEAGDLPLDQLPDCFRHMDQVGDGERAGTLGQMVLENIDLEAHAPGALEVACAALAAAPRSAELRRVTIDLYDRVYGETRGFAGIMESSGLSTGGAARAALRVLDFCLSLDVGDTLISRMDDRVVEVVEVDRDGGLFTLRRGDRTTTIPAREVVREYERVAAADFRVLRQLHPERLPELIQADPVALVIGLIRAHGDLIDADQLKHELVPKYIDQKEWSKWWTKTRGQLRRSPHVVIEGRSPVVLAYSAAGVSHEEETWETFVGQKDPVKWLSTVSGYLREQKARKQKPDELLLRKFRDHIVQHIETVRGWRPGEALACGLVLERLGAQGVPDGDLGREVAGDILRSADDPAGLVCELTDTQLWRRALEQLPVVRPDDWQDCAAVLVPAASAAQLDALVEVLRAAGRLTAVQQQIDDAWADPVNSPQMMCWLWKGPDNADGLRVPTDGELFRAIMDTLSALGRTLSPAPEVGREFRTRMKTALGLRNYEKAQRCIEQVSAEAAVTLRRQLDRLEGLGGNAPGRMLDMLRVAHPQLWAERPKRLAPWADPEVLWTTAAGLQKRTAERDELVNVAMAENAKRIGEAAALGDLSENSEYRFALEERDLLRARLAQINRELSLAQPLGRHDVPTDEVGVGSRVRLRAAADGSERVMLFLGAFDTDVDNGVFNYQAPVSQMLMGLRVGARATLTLDKEEREFEIVAIENGLELAGL